MMSLTSFRRDESFARQPKCGKESFHHKIPSISMQEQHCFDDIPEENTTKDHSKSNAVFSKSKMSCKGRKGKQFHMFRSSASPWKSCSYGVPYMEFVQVPSDHTFISVNQKGSSEQWRKSESNTNSRFIVKTREMKGFFRLTDDTVIQDFLKTDNCKRIADKYLIAMVFAYFKRADFSVREYTRMNFFIGLYLANDVEEDEEEIKYEIFPWVLGENWRGKYSGFLRMRDALLKKIDYKAIISRRCCDEIMAIEPTNSLWTRERPFYHGGAIRNYMKDPDDDGFPRGPDATPRYCSKCDASDSQYDSASPVSTSWYISSQSCTTDSDDLKGMSHVKEDDIWPSPEE